MSHKTWPNLVSNMTCFAIKQLKFNRQFKNFHTGKGLLLEMTLDLILVNRNDLQRNLFVHINYGFLVSFRVKKQTTLFEHQSAPTVESKLA